MQLWRGAAFCNCRSLPSPLECSGAPVVLLPLPMQALNNLLPGALRHPRLLVGQLLPLLQPPGRWRCMSAQCWRSRSCCLSPRSEQADRPAASPALETGLYPCARSDDAERGCKMCSKLGRKFGQLHPRHGGRHSTSLTEARMADANHPARLGNPNSENHWRTAAVYIDGALSGTSGRGRPPAPLSVHAVRAGSRPTARGPALPTNP